MAYSTIAPNRINGPEAWIDVEGSADHPPAGYTSIYLLDCCLKDWNGNLIKIETDFYYVYGSVPALVGIDGQPWVQYTPAWIHLRLAEPHPIPTGDYKFCFTLETTDSTATSLGGGDIQRFELPIFIAQTPLAVPVIGPAIPGLQHWQDKMIELAERWSPEILNPNNTWGEQNWYYDVASTYFAVSDYLRKSNRYSEVAFHSAKMYEQYVRESYGNVSVWKVFARGLRQCYERDQQGHWIDTLKLLSTHGWAYYGGDIDPGTMRESAYASDVWRELTYVDAGDRTMLEKSITFLLGQFNTLFAQEYGKGEDMVCEPMFFGLAAQSLVDYYDLVPDDRIPETLMGACRYIWDKGVDQHTGYTRYDIFVPSGDWYTGLNPMMINAWGFLYNVTGNDLYRQQGDILFEHFFDDGNWQWSPKQFAQIFRRSSDYVTRWRA